MNKDYRPGELEPKWGKVWDETKLYESHEDAAKPKHYQLEYFPYPSGVTMHVGHVRNYVMSDAYSRFARMRGKNVLHPMGWDAFGLPAENQAIKVGVPPRQSTDSNIAIFKRQLSAVGLSYDWSREIDSSRPDYYHWTQWLFLLFYKRQLAYKAEALVNWCPHDKTVLANEQVIKQGDKNVCERCGHEVEKRNLNQWFFKITDYADRLLEDLKSLDWPENIKAMQRNWIGRSQGTTVKFAVDDSKETIEVFTTRLDTLYGATFIVLAPEHPLVKKLTTTEHKSEVDDYIKKTAGETDIERQSTDRTKTGVFTGSYAINPASDEKVSVWVADYVLVGYGTGAIMAVPAHDERDREFAEKFKLSIRHVVDPVVTRPDAAKHTEFKRKGKIVAVVENQQGQLLTINWGPQLGGRLFVGGTVEGDEAPEMTARREIGEETGYYDLDLVELGDETFHYKYFAHSKGVATEADTRFLHFKLTKSVAVATKLESDEEGKFKVEWVDVATARREVNDPLHRYGFDKFIDHFGFNGDGLLVNSGQFDGLTSAEARTKITEFLAGTGGARATTNYRMHDWLISRQRYWGVPIPIVYCDKCGIVPVPEDQLPVVLPELESFEPDGSGRSPLARVEDWVNVSCPECGGPAKRETDTMDGFVDSSWYFLRFADPHNNKMAFDPKKVAYWLPVDTYVGGAEHAVAHLLFARFWTKVLADAGLVDFPEPFLHLRNQGMIGGADGRKMGKRYGNVVTPDDIIGQGYGADALRVYELFIGPYNQSVDWNPRGIDGAQRFLKRVWALVYDFTEGQGATVKGQAANTELETALVAATHRTIKKVTDDLGDFGFNTAVAALMEYTNELYKLRVELSFEAAPAAWKASLATLVQLVAPLAPFAAEELWQALGNTDSVHVSEWPRYEEKYVRNELVEVAIQVNGKLRGTLTATPDISDDDLKRSAAEIETVKKYLEGKVIKKTIVVPRKLVNFVV